MKYQFLFLVALILASVAHSAVMRSIPLELTQRYYADLRAVEATSKETTQARTAALKAIDEYKHARELMTELEEKLGDATMALAEATDAKNARALEEIHKRNLKADLQDKAFNRTEHDLDVRVESISQVRARADRSKRQAQQDLEYALEQQETLRRREIILAAAVDNIRQRQEKANAAIKTIQAEQARLAREAEEVAAKAKRVQAEQTKLRARAERLNVRKHSLMTMRAEHAAAVRKAREIVERRAAALRVKQTQIERDHAQFEAYEAKVLKEHEAKQKALDEAREKQLKSEIQLAEKRASRMRDLAAEVRAEKARAEKRAQRARHDLMQAHKEFNKRHNK